jgi:hypothetical protein
VSVLEGKKYLTLYACVFTKLKCTKCGKIKKMLILFFDLDQQEIFDNYKILINMGTFDLDFFLSSSHIHCTPHMKPEIQEPHIMISTYIRRNYTSKLSAIPVWSKTLGYTTVCGAGTQIHVTHHLLVLNMNTLTDYSVYEI